MGKLDTSKGAMPMYLQIYQILKKDILSNVYTKGELIPSEALLQKKYDVSRITARQAIAQLEQDGLVERARGKGTRVKLQDRIEEDLLHIKSFTDEMRERGMEPGTSYAHMEIVHADRECAQVFHCEEKDELYRLSRVRTANKEPIVYFVTYFSKDKNLPLDDEKYQGSMYELLKELNIPQPKKTKEMIHAIKASKNLAEKLHIQKNDAVLIRKRISYDEMGRVLEYTISYYPGEKYSYAIERSV